jgi:YggT family protein
MEAAVFGLIDTILFLLMAVLIVNAVLSWLVSFDIVDRRNRIVAQIWDVTTRLTDPILAPIRKVVPAVGGVDFSPLVLLLGIGFVRALLPG